MCHDWPPNSPQTDNPRNNGEKTIAYIIFLDVQKAYDKAWLDAIMYALLKKRSRREKPKNDKKNSTQTSLREYKQDTASQEESTSKITSDKEEYYQS